MGSAERAVQRVANQWGACIDVQSSSGCVLNSASSGRYANPAAFHVGTASHAVAAFVLLGEGHDQVMREIDDLARIMALDEGPASASMKSFTVLRTVVQADESFQALSPEGRNAALERVDACLLHAIDAYVAAREALLNISIEELKRRNKMLENIQGEPFMAAREVRA